MSDLENRYNSPETQVVPEQVQSAGNLTEPMLRFLRETSPWLRFIGIVGFISCGIIVVLGIVSLFFTDSLSDIINTPAWIASLFYIISGVIVFIPSFFEYKAGTLIRKYSYSRTDTDLEEALKNNKSLWKFYGILVIISLAFIPVLIILSLVIGIASVFNF